MFKNLILIAAIVILFWVVKGFIRRVQLEKKPSSKSRDMVQCEQCKAYLPKDDAIVSDNKTFCSQQHLNDWNRTR